MTASLLESAVGSAKATAAFDASAVLQAVLDFEAALVRAEAAEGLMPLPAAQAIAGVCRIGLYDLPSLAAAAAACGDPVTPLLARLRETVALFDADAAAFVHGESVRRVALQTAVLLQLRRALALVDRDLGRLLREALDLASLPSTADLGLSRGAIESAVLRLLSAQRDLRERGAAALQLTLAADGVASTGEPRLPDAVAIRVAKQLELPHRSDPAAGVDAALIRLSTEVALLCAGIERLFSLLQQAGGSASDADAVDLAAATVRAAAVRAPQRVAAQLALARDQAGCELVAAEAAALLSAAHGGVAATRRATLAHAAASRAGASRPPARDQRSVAATTQFSPEPGERLRMLIAQATQQADQAPWQRWAD